VAALALAQTGLVAALALVQTGLVAALVLVQAGLVEALVPGLAGPAVEASGAEPRHGQPLPHSMA
jgi:hypothetical protein